LFFLPWGSLRGKLNWDPRKNPEREKLGGSYENGICDYSSRKMEQGIVSDIWARTPTQSDGIQANNLISNNLMRPNSLKL
jgi:hypothetical protein